MFRLLGSGLFGVVLLILWIYCIFDVIATDSALTRNLPKMVWLLVVVFIPTIGSVAWLALGRPLYAGWRPGDTTMRAPPLARGPEDAPTFLRRPDDAAARLQAWEDDLLRRERELRPGDDKPEEEGLPPSRE